MGIGGVDRLVPGFAFRVVTPLRALLLLLAALRTGRLAIGVLALLAGCLTRATLTVCRRCSRDRRLLVLDHGRSVLLGRRCAGRYVACFGWACVGWEWGRIGPPIGCCLTRLALPLIGLAVLDTGMLVAVLPWAVLGRAMPTPFWPIMLGVVLLPSRPIRIERAATIVIVPIGAEHERQDA